MRWILSCANMTEQSTETGGARMRGWADTQAYLFSQPDLSAVSPQGVTPVEMTSGRDTGNVTVVERARWPIAGDLLRRSASAMRGSRRSQIGGGSRWSGLR